MITRLYIATLAVIFLASCHRPEAYPLSKSDILDSLSKMRGVIIIEKGANGPYKEEGTLTGSIGDAGSNWAGEGPGRISVSWPTSPGYFYESTGYINAKKEGFIIVRKVPGVEAMKAKPNEVEAGSSDGEQLSN